MLSAGAKQYLVVGLASKKYGTEIANAIDSGANKTAADVTAITIPALTGVDGTGSNAAPLAGVNTQLGNIQTKINAILTALKNASLMA